MHGYGKSKFFLTIPKQRMLPCSLTPSNKVQEDFMYL